MVPQTVARFSVYERDVCVCVNVGHGFCLASAKLTFTRHLYCMLSKYTRCYVACFVIFFRGLAGHSVSNEKTN